MNNLEQYIEELQVKIHSLESKLKQLNEKEESVLAEYKETLEKITREINQKYNAQNSTIEAVESPFDQIEIELNNHELNQALNQIYKL